jgi:hypothetical protein
MLDGNSENSSEQTAKVSVGVVVIEDWSIDKRERESRIML